MESRTQKRVVIVGMGFGGLQAAKTLAGHGLEVLCLDRHNYHLFQPLLYQVATATLNVEAIAQPTRTILRGYQNVQFQMADVRAIDLSGKTIDAGDEKIAFDYLIVAAGSVTNFFGLDSVRAHAFDLKELQDAVTLRNHILSMFERAARESDAAKRRALMTFVVAGGGPTGVEFAGALSELAHHVLQKDFPDLNSMCARIVLVEAMDKVLAPFPEKLQKYTIAKLEKMGVEVRLQTALQSAAPDHVMLGDDERLDTHTLFWAAGVQASALAKTMQIPQARGGRLMVGDDLSLPAQPDAFVIGDMMYREQNGAPLPAVAPVAIQSGAYAARAILARERGKTLKPFRYFDKGSMAVIGRYAAVARTGKLKLKGFTAWVAWLGLHLLYLTGFRNRLFTLLSWGYDYLLFDRQVRLITRNESEAMTRPASTLKPVSPLAKH